MYSAVASVNILYNDFILTFFSELYNLTADDLVFQASPLTFDPSVVEMFSTLCSGATLLSVPDLLKAMPSQLKEVLCGRYNVTVLQVCITHTQ